MKRECWLRIGLLVGLMDLTTGLLLMAEPGMVVALLGVTMEKESLEYLRWIGVFVAAVGFSYTGLLRGEEAAREVLRLTAWVRGLVAVWLIGRISSGGLPAAWVTVAVVDGLVALGQLMVLRRWEGGGGS